MKTMQELMQLSIQELSELIQSRQISIEHLVQAHIDHIRKVNPSINAIVSFYPETALAEARRLDDLLDQGEYLGPLHGIPFTVKDVFDVAEQRTTAGSLGVDYVAEKDAIFVTRLKTAGAICLGKTNTPEFENSADTDNKVFGATKNPYDTTRSAGGSSGGCGAAVAAGCCVFSIGADHGGSTRIPAHYNGITTIRTMFRRIPSTGYFADVREGAISTMNSECPLTRHVANLELILKAMQGPDATDPLVEDFVGTPSSTIAVVDLNIAYFSNDGNCDVMPETIKSVANAVTTLERAGASVSHTSPPKLSEGFEIYQQICGPVATKGFQGLFNQYSLSPSKRSSLIKLQLRNFEPYLCDDDEYAVRLERWQKFKDEVIGFFDEYDVLISPVTATDALPLTEPMWDGKVHYLSFCWETSAAMFSAVVVRAGTSDSGLPIGIQILTKPHNEHIALAVAHEIEQKLGGWQRPSFQ